MTLIGPIGYETVRATAIRALRNAGIPDDLARIQADLWLAAELRGHPSHGLLRLPRIVERIASGVVSPTAQGRSAWIRPGYLQVDGENGLGPVVVGNALREVCERARETGIALAAVHNCNHLGMLAVYAEQVAAQGQVLIALTVSEALVHPWGGRHAMVGTNPIAIGVPASPEPFVLDMATSVVSMGKVHDYAARGQALEPGWALDADGNPTTDAAEARHGALSPFGDAKGYALGLAFEVLVGALTASALGTDVKGTLDSTIACNKGDIFIVIEPADAGRVGAITAYLDLLRASTPADVSRPVSVPGDRARRNRDRHLAEGLRFESALWQKLNQLAGTPLAAAEQV